MTKLPISVCIVAGNEAHRIRPALDSVQGWTSEIVVVLNDDVNDGTDKLAEEFGAKVFREPWKGFGLQKQSAADKCTQPWLLNLDADEVVSPELRGAITDLLADEKRAVGNAAYSFPRCSFYCGRWIRHGDWYPDWQIRFWQRGRARWSDAPVHEKLLVNGCIGRLRGDIQHYSMESLNHHVRKATAYSNIFLRHQLAIKRNTSFVQTVFRPWWRFFRSYFLRLGFLDGWQGYVIARMIAFETFLRYTKLREAQSPPAIDPKRPQ